jgi:hypothetical protein
MWLLLEIAAPIVAAFTIASGALYMREWLGHMANGPEKGR